MPYEVHGLVVLQLWKRDSTTLIDVRLTGPPDAICA
jgi:hypothetical protein